MKNELRILIEHLEKLQKSLENMQETQKRVDNLEKFRDYLKGAMAVGAMVVATYGYILYELVKKIL